MNKTTVVATVSFMTLAVALVLGASVLGVDASTTPLVTTVLGFIGLAITQSVAASKAEKTEAAVTELNKDLRNGTFERLVREAITKIAADEATSLHITQTRKEEENGRG